MAADKREKNYSSQVVIQYVEGVSETVDLLLKKYDVVTAHTWRLFKTRLEDHESHRRRSEISYLDVEGSNMRGTMSFQALTMTSS